METNAWADAGFPAGNTPTHKPARAARRRALTDDAAVYLF
jgi:hypothetical protein